MQILLRRAEKAPRSRAQAMERRPPAVIGIECPAASREFRWNHGQVLFALSLSQAQGVFVPLGPYPLRGTTKGEKIMSTPHNTAAKGDFAKTVLMPGDPLRAQFIAETFLENPKLVNNVRGVQGYTGTYKGVKVSVMASGMGMPAIGIYSHELYNGYGVENIIRVGSAGAIQEDIHLYDLVIAQGACTDSNWASQYHLPGTFAPIGSWELITEAVKAAENNGARYHVGNVNSSDTFYGDHEGVPEGLDSVYGLKKMGVMALEMEAAALYMNAARYGKRALCICTISDHILTGELTTSEERQNSFTTMMKVALDVAVAMEKK